MLQPDNFVGGNYNDAYQRQLLAEAQKRAQKHIEPMEIDHTEAGTVKIFNVGPRIHDVAMGGLGKFLIQACPEKRAYSEPLEIWKQYPEGKNDDMNKMSLRLLDGYRVAESIVSYGPYTDPTSDLRKWGVFVCGAEVTVKAPGKEPVKMLAGSVREFMKMNRKSKIIADRVCTKVAIQAARKNGDRRTNEEIEADVLAANLPTEFELDEAHRRLTEYCMDLVALANGYFQANNLIEIQPIHRWAAVRTNNQGLPWVKGALLMNKCPVCAVPVDPDAAICSNINCGTVLKPEVVIANRVLKYEYLWNPAHPAYVKPKE